LALRQQFAEEKFPRAKKLHKLEDGVLAKREEFDQIQKQRGSRAFDIEHAQLLVLLSKYDKAARCSSAPRNCAPVRRSQKIWSKSSIWPEPRAIGAPLVSPER
jgi:hypothetical protein